MFKQTLSGCINHLHTVATHTFDFTCFNTHFQTYSQLKRKPGQMVPLVDHLNHCLKFIIQVSVSNKPEYTIKDFFEMKIQLRLNYRDAVTEGVLPFYLLMSICTMEARQKTGQQNQPFFKRWTENLRKHKAECFYRKKVSDKWRQECSTAPWRYNSHTLRLFFYLFIQPFLQQITHIWCY